MCGIAGILTPDAPPDRAVLARMLSAQRHRGPDGEGAVVSGPLGLGAVRLAVLDRTAAASQPMTTRSGRFTLAYNGEVYNWRELRRELEGQGLSFRSSGDTEMVLQALGHWGEAALERFDGVFALAFWDDRERRLVLARDRIGVRPLYWAEAGRDLLFASEIKGILASGRVRPSVDGPALAELFRFQNVWSQRTLFSGVLPVPPGAVLSWKDGRRTLRNGWRFDFPGGGTETEAGAVDALRGLLAGAVSRQLASDVPLGCALSGGLDGAALAAEAKAGLPELDTFTVGFGTAGAARPGERAVDERGAARAVSAFLGTRHHEVEVGAMEALDGLPALVRHLEEPRLAASFQNLAGARLARRHVTVVFSGGGGDEVFAGYPWRYAPILGCRDVEAFAKAFSGVWSRVLAPGEEGGFWTAEGLRLVGQGDPEGVLRGLAAEAGDVPPLHRALSVEARTFLPAYCVLEDKLHMAAGAEVRVPLMDWALVDWARKLPEPLRLGPDGGGKRLLRAALAGRLPAETLQAPKRGFVPPLLSWAGDPAWMGKLRGILLDPRTTGRGWIRPEALARDLDALGVGSAAPLQRVWTCLAFETWCREFLEG